MTVLGSLARFEAMATPRYQLCTREYVTVVDHERVGRERIA